MNISSPVRLFSNTSIPDEGSRGMVMVVLESCLFIVLNCAALFGNLLVCVILKRNPSLFKVTNIFILSLAFTDLLMAVFVMPLVTASSIANRWVAGDFVLKVRLFCEFVLTETSFLTVMLIAINRYVKVTKPKSYRTIFRSRNAKLMALAAWILPTLLNGVAFPFLGVHFRNFSVNPSRRRVVVTSRVGLLFYQVSFIISIIVPGLTVLFCCLKIFKTIRHHNRAGAPSTLQTRSSYGVAEKRIGKTLAAVVGFYYLCWLPGLIARITYSIFPSSFETAEYRKFFYTFPAFISSVANPIIYGVMNRSFRSEIYKIFCDLR